MKTAASGLPQGDPSARGISLDPKIPGQATYSHSNDDPRVDRHDDESMYRVDEADDLTKSQTTPDSIDWKDVKPRYTSPGTNVQPKTKYPYRGSPPREKNSMVLRVAATMPGVLTGLNPLVKQRSEYCTVSLDRADITHLNWSFTVDCGNGPKTVKMKAIRPKSGVTDIGKMDVQFSCTCKAWRWLGSEHHAKGEAYLKGKPVGTASVPVIKDPEGINRVCKHVAAVMSKTRKWKIPEK